MTSVRIIAIASFAVLLWCQPLVGQTPFQYREYALGSSVASVVKISKTRDEGTRMLHERPARIQEVVWHTSYVSPGTELADPVRDVRFSFYDDQLYQLVVTYDRDRMEGLTNDDVIESIAATYGVPLLRYARTADSPVLADLAAERTVVAQWEDAASVLTLLRRDTYSPQFQLVLISKALNPRARAAIKEALRLDTQEAPQREREQHAKEVADARVASQKARVVNKAAFKP
jgi:hypothetical protein